MAKHPKKIAVLNLSGNVGKTTLAAHLLAAHLPEAKVLKVENENNSEALNIDSLQVEELKASQFKHIYHSLMFEDDLILDVGASQVSRFMEELTKFRSSIKELDLIVVPTVPDKKQQMDTIATIEWLHNLGVPANRIRVVFNQYNGEDTVGETYAEVIGYSQDKDGEGKATWLPHPIVSSNEVFQIITQRGRTVLEVAKDPTDWIEKRKEAKAAKDMAALEAAIEGQMTHDLAVTGLANLEQAFEDLMAPFAKSKK